MKKIKQKKFKKNKDVKLLIQNIEVQLDILEKFLILETVILLAQNQMNLGEIQMALLQVLPISNAKQNMDSLEDLQKLKLGIFQNLISMKFDN